MSACADSDIAEVDSRARAHRRAGKAQGARAAPGFRQAHLRSGGPDAAAQWLARHQHDKRVRVEQKATGTFVAVVVATLITAVIAGGIIALAVFVRC